MTKYRVPYTLQGEIIVEAIDEYEASQIVRGVHPSEPSVTDQELINGIERCEGYDSKFAIESDAIVVFDMLIKEVKDGETN
jgi:hypothetical protein